MIDDKFSDEPKLNEEKFRQTVYDGIAALDEIVSYGYDIQPLDENRTCIDDWRSLGLGLFGVADALVAMKLKYGSEKANAFMGEVMKMMLLTALRSSCDRAKKLGTFGKYRWEATKQSPVMDLVKELDPTGTISLLMGSYSGGCEPLYKISYERTTHKMEDVHGSFRVYAHSVKDLLEYHNLPLNLTDEEIIERFPWIVESHEVPFDDRVKLQAVMQKYVDNSISSTVNLKHDATPEDIFQIYMDAWESGCKGITAFRDGCRRGNILGVDENAKADEKKADGKVEKVNFEPKKQEPTCPHCGSHQIHVEGHCTTCNECGWSTCSLVEGA